MLAWVGADERDGCPGRPVHRHSPDAHLTNSAEGAVLQRLLFRLSCRNPAVCLSARGRRPLRDCPPYRSLFLVRCFTPAGDFIYGSHAAQAQPGLAMQTADFGTRRGNGTGTLRIGMKLHELVRTVAGTAKIPLTRRRNSGRTCASNQGWLIHHDWLRGLGCGKGKYKGR